VNECFKNGSKIAHISLNVCAHFLVKIENQHFDSDKVFSKKLLKVINKSKFFHTHFE